MSLDQNPDLLARYTELQGARILVVDDNQSIRVVVRRYLQKCGVLITEAANGQEAIEIALREDPELILMDVDMPILDGLSACRQLRMHETTRFTPLIFLTGRDDEERHIQALSVGGDDFMAKPFTPPVLVARIANLVHRHRSEKEVQRLLKLVRQYVSQPVREGRTSGGIETVEATILFSDLRGFTATSLHEDPTMVFRAISAVLAKQTEMVVRHGGYVDKFSGDGMLAVFEGGNNAAEACLAAQEIVQWASTFEGISFWNPPPIGIGIHHGTFLRGDLGGEAQREYTVIGGTVNIAARLCGVAKALEVIISDAVRERFVGDLRCSEAELVNLKGLSDQARIYRLTGVAADGSAA